MSKELVSSSSCCPAAPANWSLLSPPRALSHVSFSAVLGEVLQALATRLLPEAGQVGSGELAPCYKIVSCSSLAQLFMSPRALGGP